jgi:hypothetical protein
MIKIIRHIIQHLGRRQRPITINPNQTNQSTIGFCNLPPGLTPIESLYEMHPIPGTNLSIGKVEKVLQATDGELTTYSQTIGIRCGCGHEVFSVDQTERQGGAPGRLSRCPYCAIEAATLLNQNLISVQQAQQMVLHCPMCESHCDGCGRKNVCCRHTTPFQDVDVRSGTLLLCPDCLRKAEREKFFNKTLAVMFSPFVDYNHLPPPREKRGSNDF